MGTFSLGISFRFLSMADQAASQPSATEETSVDDGVTCAVAPAGEATGKNSQDDPELNELLNSEWHDMVESASLRWWPQSEQSPNVKQWQFVIQRQTI